MEVNIRRFIALSILALFLVFPRPAHAHLAGQLPFFKINGQFAGLYPVPLTSLENFNLPQDLAPANYLVNTPLNFEIDLSQFPGSADTAAQTRFTWDFADGQKGSGLRQTHTYTKIGSYIMAIYAEDNLTKKPQLFESALINILPNANYQLPKAIIKISGKTSKDPLTDILRFNLNQTLKFDATTSVSANKITDYLWDFGDRLSSTEGKVNHNYSKTLVNGQGQVFPVLRVKDANGFIADTFVEVENQNYFQKTLPGNQASPSAKTSRPNQLKFTLIGLAILFAAIFLGRRFLVKKR